MRIRKGITLIAILTCMALLVAGPAFGTISIQGGMPVDETPFSTAYDTSYPMAELDVFDSIALDAKYVNCVGLSGNGVVLVAYWNGAYNQIFALPEGNVKVVEDGTLGKGGPQITFNKKVERKLDLRKKKIVKVTRTIATIRCYPGTKGKIFAPLTGSYTNFFNLPKEPLG